MEPDSSYHKWDNTEEVKLTVQGVSSTPRRGGKALCLLDFAQRKSIVILYVLLVLCFVIFAALFTANLWKLSQDLAEAQLDQDKIRRHAKRNLSELQDSLELKMSEEFNMFNSRLLNVSQDLAEAQLDQDKIRRDAKRNLSELQDSLELKMSEEFNMFNSRLLNVSEELVGLRLGIQEIQADHRKDPSDLQDSKEIWNLTHSMWKELAEVRRNHARLQEVLSRVQEELRNITELCTKCPPGWQHFKKNCYFFSTSTKSWSEAKQLCTYQGSHLVIVNSMEEHAFLSNSVIEARVYWLGLSDSAKEGEWRWLDGSLLSIKFWAKGEPNDVGHQGEDCGTLRFDGVWNDLVCSMAVYWICEQQC